MKFDSNLFLCSSCHLLGKNMLAAQTESLPPLEPEFKTERECVCVCVCVCVVGDRVGDRPCARGLWAGGSGRVLSPSMRAGNAE